MMMKGLDTTVSKKLTNLDFLWLEITSKCNLSCTHCYADSSPKNSLCGVMELKDWVRAIDEGADLGCQGVQFIGGEPTLHPGLAKMIEAASNRKYKHIEVFTNATTLTRNLVGCFRDNGVRVATSFYSHDPHVHNGITKGKRSWDRTVNGINNAVQAKLPLRVGVIELERNNNHIQQTIAFLKTLGVSDIGVDRQRGVGRSEKPTAESSGELYSELCGQCWKGKLCITASSEAFPCVFSRRTSLGSAKHGLGEILNSAVLIEFRKTVQELDLKRANSSGVQAQCYPDSPCSPQTCNPILPCQPQGPFCSPDSQCSPDYRCQPDNGVGIEQQA